MPRRRTDSSPLSDSGVGFRGEGVAIDGVTVRCVSELPTELSCSATWLPAIQVRLGDVGVLRDWPCGRVRSLHHHGIDFKTGDDLSTGLFRYVSFDAGTSSFPAAVGSRIGALRSSSPMTCGRHGTPYRWISGSTPRALIVAPPSSTLWNFPLVASTWEATTHHKPGEVSCLPHLARRTRNRSRCWFLLA